MIAPREFDLLGQLPTGTTVLEASAGTGKTFTIAGLVARYLAEGVVRMDELLVVTFGRMATQELRDRVRERLVSARDGLADAASARANSADALLRQLATGDAATIATRRERLAAALACFDAATVATTHTFCRQVLIGLGTGGDYDTDTTLVEDVDDLLVEVVRDLYLRKWAADGASGAPELTYRDALGLARAVVDDSQAGLVPEDSGDGGTADVRRRFAERARFEVDARKRARRLVGFEDLLSRLQQTLGDPRTGPAAVARLRHRYRVVLVDEFQDTDPVQWQILRLGFHEPAPALPPTTLVLIGDPKQAIYAFRGADVQAYLAAVQVADSHATLARNWRSDADLLRGLDAVFRGAALGDPRIVVAPVSAAHTVRSLVAADSDAAPVQIRVIGKGERRALYVDEARARVISDVVAQIVALLEGTTRLRPRTGEAERPVRPGDIAVLAPLGSQLDLVHAALLDAGVPAVRRTTTSVFRTPAGTDWMVLLEALEQPHRPARLRRLGLSAFLGWDAATLLASDVDELGLRVRRWLRVFGERGIAALFELVAREEDLPARILRLPDGERRLTDIRHVGEALHAAAVAGTLGLTASLEWLRRRVDEAAADATLDRSRRLDSDAAAVQLVTVHSSKGLEFPIVLVPFSWDRHVRDADIPLYHDDTGRRVRNVGGSGSPGFVSDQRRNDTEAFGEDLRLLYVALTRAQGRVLAWWTPSLKNTPPAPLHRLLFAADPALEVPERVAVPDDTAALAALQARAVDGALSVTHVLGAQTVTLPRRSQPTARLGVAVLGRAVGTDWRRTSYSALTAAVHDAPSVGSEPEIEAKDDEPDTPVLAVGGAPALRAVASPMADLPGGTAFGTLVHSVLELLDPTAGDLESALGEIVALQVARFAPGELDPAALTDALLPSLRTPLGPLTGGRSLAEIPLADRLVELSFELPLRGGDRPNGTSHLRDIARLLRVHLPADDSLLSYAELLDDPVLGSAALTGYLNGSIDAVLRVDGRYLVVDYKTNWLGLPDEPLSAWDYRGPAMSQAMLHAHYPLQALLYDVALHRFLRWRVADYHPEQHLGGALYLFLRGMCGPGVVAQDGTVPGVFAWRPPAALVVALSDLLALGAP